MNPTRCDDSPVLIVEGDADHRLLLQMGLEAVGFDCHVCPDASSALDWLDGSRARVIVSDWRPPGALDAAVRSRSDAPLILLNAHGSGPYLDRSTPDGRERKPMAIHALVDTLDRLAGRACGRIDAHPTAPVRVLLVEDNPADVELVAEALDGCPVAQALEVIGDGAAALQRLIGPVSRGRPPLPDIVVLDLNLPRLDGFAVLDGIKGNPHTRATPVIMLTTSDDQHDVDEAYRRGADGFVTKPFEISHFIDVLRTLAVYWTDVVTLPARGA